MEPPGTGTLDDQIKTLQQRITELGRKKPVPPTCQMHLTTTVEYTSGNQHHFATANWAVSTDSTGTMGRPGGVNLRSYVHIPVTGWYYLHFHAAVSVPADASGSIKIVRNGPDVASGSVATSATVRATGWTPLDAIRSRIYLQADDLIFWSSHATAGPYQIPGTVYTIPTEVTVMYLQS